MQNTTRDNAAEHCSLVYGALVIIHDEDTMSYVASCKLIHQCIQLKDSSVFAALYDHPKARFWLGMRYKPTTNQPEWDDEVSFNAKSKNVVLNSAE